MWSLKKHFFLQIETKSKTVISRRISREREREILKEINERRDGDKVT